MNIGGSLAVTTDFGLLFDLRCCAYGTLSCRHSRLTGHCGACCRAQSMNND